MKKVKKLIIGSAGKKHLDAVTLDIEEAHNPDVVHNLMNAPYPFEDNAFDEIVAHHVLEHMDDISCVMSELHRTCSPQGKIFIEVPHHTSCYAHNPFHKIYFSSFSFDGFIENNQTWIVGKKYRCLKKEVTFHKYYRMLFLHKLFNRYPLMYERFFCYIFPAEHFKICLQPLKK
jgi:SAM-dependent methyltransferase